MRLLKASSDPPQRGIAKNGLKPARSKSARPAAAQKAAQDHLREILTLAEQRGLLSGARTHIIRGRMPLGLVEQARLKSGIESDSRLLEAALASLAVSDDYAQWLLAQRGTVSPELNLEF